LKRKKFNPQHFLMKSSHSPKSKAEENPQKRVKKNQVEISDDEDNEVPVNVESSPGIFQEYPAQETDSISSFIDRLNLQPKAQKTCYMPSVPLFCGGKHVGNIGLNETFPSNWSERYDKKNCLYEVRLQRWSTLTPLNDSGGNNNSGIFERDGEILKSFKTKTCFESEREINELIVKKIPGVVKCLNCDKVEYAYVDKFVLQLWEDPRYFAPMLRFEKMDFTLERFFNHKAFQTLNLQEKGKFVENCRKTIFGVYEALLKEGIYYVDMQFANVYVKQEDDDYVCLLGDFGYPARKIKNNQMDRLKNLWNLYKTDYGRLVADHDNLGSYLLENENAISFQDENHPDVFAHIERIIFPLMTIDKYMHLNYPQAKPSCILLNQEQCDQNQDRCQKNEAFTVNQGWGNAEAFQNFIKDGYKNLFPCQERQRRQRRRIVDSSADDSAPFAEVSVLSVMPFLPFVKKSLKRIFRY